MKKINTDGTVEEINIAATERHRELHEALGLHPGDFTEFTWKDLLDIVRREVAAISAVRRVVESV